MGLLTSWPEGTYPADLPSGLSAPGFSAPTATFLAWCSQLAYEVEDHDKTRRILAGWGWSLDRLLFGKGTSLLPMAAARGFVASRHKVGVLSFAGTEPTSLADWLTDLQFFPDGNQVHEGFAEAFDSVASQLEFGAVDTLFITGHSLGAALAAIAATRLSAVDIKAVYVFGMPRVGSAEFVASYGQHLSSRTYRLVYGDDMVPSLPPEEFGFRHVGHVLRCGHGGRFDAATLLDPDTVAASPGDVPDGSSRRALSPGGTASLVLQRLRILAPDPADAALPAWPVGGWFRTVVDCQPREIRDHLLDRYLFGLGSRVGNGPAAGD